MQTKQWNHWAVVFVATLAAVALTGLTGCESSSSDDNSGSSSGGSGGGSVVGRWAVHSATGNTWWSFNSDGTFVMYNDPGFASRHLGGTYSQSGNKVTGPFVNPGVGNGDISVTVSDDGNTIQMDFIEHWHSPSKHVPLSGTRM